MRLAALFTIAVLLGGCSRSAPVSTLPTEKITIDTANGPVRFTVEIASDPASQERGLMFRTAMALNAGMLFDLHQPQIARFWMKNTILPLDMLFVRADGTIASIADNTEPYSLDVISSDEPVLAVIELNAGRAYYMGIEPGDRVHASIFPPS
jgi:uncharacterized membrane protein (UPF0127 family)